MNRYHLVITGADPVGFQFINNVIEMAALGAVLKEGTIPFMGFPRTVSMTLDAELPPTPTASIRVFEEGTNKEIHATLHETKGPAATFSMEEKDLSTQDDGTPWTRELLDSLTWDEVKAIGKSVGVTGRDREKVIKGYLEKVSVSE